MARSRPDFRGGGADPRQTLQQAVAAHRQGQLERAEKLYRAVLKTLDRHTDVHRNLALVLDQLGRRADALKAIRRAIELDPGRADLHATEGGIHLQLGRADRAAGAFRRALELDPGSVDLRCQLAAALDRQGDVEGAERELRLAVARDERGIRAWHDLGVLLTKLGRFDEAEACLDRVLAIDPAQVSAWVNLGNVARLRDDVATAIARYERAAELAPKSLGAWMNLGQVRREAGRIDDAVAAYRRAVELAPDEPQPRILLALARRATERDADVTFIERLAKDPRRIGPDPHVALFTWAKVLEDLGEHDEAFAVLLRANAMKRRTVDYDEARERSRFQRIREVFTAERIASHGAHGCADETPVFVLGMPRSATSLVEQILASHPEVHGAGELEDLREVLTDPARFASGHPDGFVDPAPAALRAAGEDYVARLRRRAHGARRVVDKAPLNFLLIGAIRCALPRARIVHCVRDPRDTCLSIFRHDFAGSSYGFAYDLAELGRYHVMHDELMEHWRGVAGPDAILDVRYEELVDDLEGEARRLCAFAGLGWDPRCLEFHRTERAVRTSSMQQVKTPLFRSSLAAWRRYEGRLGPLLAALGLAD